MRILQGLGVCSGRSRQQRGAARAPPRHLAEDSAESGARAERRASGAGVACASGARKRRPSGARAARGPSILFEAGRFRPRFDRLWADFGRNGADASLIRSGSARVCPNLDNFDPHRPLWPGIDQICADFDRFWANFGQLRPNLVRNRLRWARHRPNLVRFRPTLARLPDIGEVRPRSAQDRPSLARHRPNLARFGPTSASNRSTLERSARSLFGA